MFGGILLHETLPDLYIEGETLTGPAEFFFTFAKLLRNKVYVIGPLKYDVSFVVKFLFTTFATYLNYTKFNSVHMEVVLSGCIQRSCVNL